MANQYGLFWNSQNNDRLYDADSFSELFQKFFTNGVFNGDLEVLSTGGMDVTVQTGYTCINGKVRFFDTADQITVSPASGSYPRIDSIVIERNDTDRLISIKYVQGDYSGNTPTATAPVRSGGIYQIVLAHIYVGVGVVELTQADITDTRADTDLCGWVVGTVDEVDVSQMTAQAQADFEAWYQSMKDQLSEDAAGRLQLEIDDINDTLDEMYYVNNFVVAPSDWNNYHYTLTDSHIVAMSAGDESNIYQSLSLDAISLTYAEYDIVESAGRIKIESCNNGSMVIACESVPTGSIRFVYQRVIYKEAQ